MESVATKILVNAKELISKKENWGRNNDVTVYKKDSVEYTAYCMLGALNRASELETNINWNGSPSPVQAARHFIKEAIVQISHRPRLSIAAWNDCKGRTHKQVMAAMDKAIQLSRED